MTVKHVVVILIGSLTAAFGAWITMRAPGAQSGAMIVAIGASTISGALGHAGQGARRSPTAGEHTPTGFAGRD